LEEERAGETSRKEKRVPREKRLGKAGGREQQKGREERGKGKAKKLRGRRTYLFESRGSLK